MNKAPLLEIEPKELQFTFELKKQSSCTVQLTNNTNHYVAFKVKTTSPKKYSVRPNVGVLLPKSNCEFIVTMQAQRVAPEDMECKDKFLIQSTMVSAETTSEDVTSSLFAKDGRRYVEENKLKVILISTPNQPEFFPVNGDFKNGVDHEKVQIFSEDEIQSPELMVFKNPEHNMVHEVLKNEEDQELKPDHHKVVNTVNDVEMPIEEVSRVSKGEELNTLKDVAELKPAKEAGYKVSKFMASNTETNLEELKLYKEAKLLTRDMDLNKVTNIEELESTKAEIYVLENPELKTVKDAEEPKPGKEAELKASKDLELRTVKVVEELKPEKEPEYKVFEGTEVLKLMEAIEEMKLKLYMLETKLNEAGVTISKLTEERRLINQETKFLQEKLEDLVNKGPRKVQVGFPLLYVCMVALICVFLGYHLRC